MSTAPQFANASAVKQPQCVGRLLTAEDVAEITGLSTETLAQWRSQRRGIPFLKISRNVVRYRPSDLDSWLTERIVRIEGPSKTRRAR